MNEASCSKIITITRHIFRFLWVHFQFLDLCDASSEFEIRKTLKNLPQGMTATYTRILEKIATNRSNVVPAQKLFKWIICVKRPMLLAELTEAVAFEATDTSWNREKVPDAVRLYQAGGNLVVIDEWDDTVRLAHHTVQQFLLDRPKHQSALATPFHFQPREADLEAGEICVAYLSFSDFERQISTLRPDNAIPIVTLPLPAAILERTTSKVGLNFGASRLFNLAYYLWTGRFSQEKEKFINIDFSQFAKLKVQPPQKMQEKYLFLNYAVDYWISHTSNLLAHNAETWRSFEKLATNKRLPFDIRPWGDVDDSNAANYTGLLCWAGNAEHRSLMKLVPQNSIIDEEQLIKEALKGQGALFEYLLTTGVDIEKKINSDGQTALLQAAMKGNMALVKFLLANGADIEATDENQKTAWSLAVEGEHTGVMKPLLAKGVDIEVTDEFYGRTALVQATMKNSTVVVKFLLDNLAKAEASDRWGCTALHEAAERGNMDIVKLLLTKQVDFDKRDNNGRTALWCAAIKGYTEIFEFLLRKGADVEAKFDSGQTALISAAKAGHLDVIKVLLTEGADIEAKGGRGQTALMNATEAGHWNVVRLLLNEGADIETKNKIGQTALIKAVDSNQAITVKLLLTEGADIEAKDNDGQTALMRAKFHGYTDIIEILRSKQKELMK